MNRSIYLYAGVLLLGVFLSAISQVLLKKAAMRVYDNIIKEYMNPLVIFAYVLFLGTTFLSILSYKGLPLSMGPILEATSYIYVTFFGVKFFSEKMSAQKGLALLLIVGGIIICVMG